ncbi:hypothetical protein IWW47_003255, partial [Coemansia sp. RSA 2052]
MPLDSGGDSVPAPSGLRRLRMEPTDRLVAMATLGGGVGAVCGGLLGGQLSGRQYLAERAHRLPTTVHGWFFYQKWKNYRVILGGMRGAAKYAARVGGCVLAFTAIEAAVDRAVGQVQAASSVVAGLVTAVGISLAVRLPKSSARRARIAGLGVGLIVGGLQDMASVFKAADSQQQQQQPQQNPVPAYIEWAR